MDLNRFPRSIPAAFLLTAFVLLVFSVGPQVGAFSDSLVSSGAPFVAGPRASSGAAQYVAPQNDIGFALVARANEALAGQYDTPQNVIGPRALMNTAVEAELESALPVMEGTIGAVRALDASSGGLQPAEELGASAQALATWAARYQGQAKDEGMALEAAAAGLNAAVLEVNAAEELGAGDKALAAWAARYQNQADALILGASGGQQTLDEWSKMVRDAYHLIE